MDVALGLAHFGTPPRRSHRYPNPREALSRFGAARHSLTWQYWKLAGLTPNSDARFEFEAAFLEATANSVRIHFNLDGFDLQRA